MQQYNTYAPYQPIQYADRLTQLQNQYNAMNNVSQMPVISQTPQVNQGLLWVSGEVGAKSYLVAPNTTVLLMDSEGQRFYLKSTDGSGMPSLRIFEYTEVPQNAPQALNTPEINLDGKYVTRDEYDGLKRLYNNILERIDSITVNEPEVKPTKSKGKVSNNESDI